MLFILYIQKIDFYIQVSSKVELSRTRLSPSLSLKKNINNKMQTLLLPAVRSGTAYSAAAGPTPPLVHRLSHRALPSPPNTLSTSHKSTQPLPLFSYSSSSSSYDPLKNKTSKLLSTQTNASNATAPAFNSQNDEAERAKLAQVKTLSKFLAWNFLIEVILDFEVLIYYLDLSCDYICIIWQPICVVKEKRAIFYMGIFSKVIFVLSSDFSLLN